MQKDKSELTVCTVFHNEQSKKFLKYNSDFSNKINSNSHWRWIAANNSKESNESAASYLGFTVVDGVSREEVFAQHPEHVCKSPLINSFHHAAALNRWYQHVDTRFMLILDNDYYIVLKNWAEKILHHMKLYNIAVFGSPWHPYHSNDHRYFPNQQAFFVDREKVDIKALNWNPVYEPFERKPWFVRHARKLPASFSKRLEVGTSKDTSHRVYTALLDTVSFESVVPVVKQWKPRSFAGQAWRVLEQMLLPDRLQLIPKKKRGYTFTSFSDLGYFDIDAHGGEEFMWEGEPYSFHVRRFKFLGRARGNAHLDEEEQFPILKQALDDFAAKIGKGGSIEEYGML